MSPIRDLHRRCRLALAATMLAAVAAFTPLAAAQDNTAVVVNTHDDTSFWRVALQIVRTADETISNSNAAVAYASCDGCEAIAIALQVVLVMGDAGTLTPTNLAIALTQSCSSCVAFANAYQFVLGTGERVRLTPEGQRQLADIRQRLQLLRQQELTFEQLRVELDGMQSELRTIFTEQLEPVGAAPAETPAPSTTAPSTQDPATETQDTPQSTESPESTPTEPAPSEPVPAEPAPGDPAAPTDAATGEPTPEGADPSTGDATGSTTGTGATP